MKIHQSIPNVNFKCALPGCSRSFSKITALKCHVYRDHQRNFKAQRTLIENDLTCPETFCSVRCNDLSSLLSHLKSHIKEGRTVACPFRQCQKRFTVLSTFTSHMSRSHKRCSVENLVWLSHTMSESEDGGAGLQSGGASEEAEVLADSVTADTEEVFPESADESLFLNNLALFYLKLQAKLLLPSTVIQTIIEDFQGIHDISQSHLLHKLSEKWVTLGISEADINNVVDVLKSEDLFRACNTGTLKTDQRRKTVFKTQFRYVEPVPLYLGQNASGKECFAQYIPIKETLKSLLQCELVRQRVQSHKQHVFCQPKDVLEDIWDGTNMRENTLFQADATSLGLILYQDAFEVANPLGSGKKKHKVLGVYLTLANMAPHNRSSVEQMQLVLLSREQDFKCFGQDVVFSSLVRDLKDLEENGIALSDGQVYRGTLCAIAGDNLGSHNIGGFTENFSKSTHFCRFCRIDRATFVSSPQTRDSTRTVESYKDNVQHIEASGLYLYNGIKYNSKFNELAFFHVCQPGLPPCLGHDIFEGIASFDLALCISHLVKQKHFTYVELNRRINHFRYLGNDANNKPSEVNPGSEKLGGHAVQNWCFLRVLPLLIGDKIENPVDNEVWQLILQLRQIVELICAPAISTGQVAYLKVLIEEYLQCRKETFPDHALKPKHHFISHYPDLIIRFGPLIRLWTLRFESKHTYFKQCARKLHNFKNLCSTLAERHQLLQAYLSAGDVFPPCVVVERGTDFFVNDYNDKIQESVAHLSFQPSNTVAAHAVSIKGTNYKMNMCVVQGKDDEGLVFGKIKLILIQNNSVYFITEKLQSVCLVDQGVHCLKTNPEHTTQYFCIDQEELLDYYPLPEYSVLGLSLIALHHSFPSLE